MIEIVSLGLNNLESIRHALNEAYSGPINFINQASETSGQGLLVLPGTGHFGAGSRELERRGFTDLLRNVASSGSRPIFGICLGMQLLFRESEEAPGSPGLSIIDGSVVGLPTNGGGHERVPRVGWAELKSTTGNGLLSTFGGRDVYFSHSYAATSFQQAGETLTSSHGKQDIVAGFISGSVAGFQFHPERSSKAGQELLLTITKWAFSEG